MTAAELLIGVACGAVLGFMITVLAGGGALFLVPVLVYVLDRTPEDAAGSSLVAVCASAVVGLVGHWRRDCVRWRVAIGFGAMSMLGAVGGSYLHRFFSPRATLLMFSAILFIAAARMGFGAMPERGDGEIRWLPLLVLGLGIGVLAGLLGVSGGFLIVPALVFLAGLGLHDAIGTAVAIVVVSAATGAITHAALGHIDVEFTSGIGAGAVAGALAGTPLAGKIPVRPLRTGFSILLAAAGAFMLSQNL